MDTGARQKARWQKAGGSKAAVTIGLAILSTSVLAVTAFAVEVSRGTAFAVEQRVWDESHQLSAHERNALEKRLARAAQRLGSPVFVVLTKQLGDETARGFAARVFRTRVADATAMAGMDAKTNPVLLALAVHDRAAAIETGKDNAGIVPEIDAERITKRLIANLAADGRNQSLARAIDEIVASAEATAARRRPLAIEENLLPAAAPTDDDTIAAAGDASTAGVGQPDSLDASKSDNAAEKPANEKAKRSRVPIAAAIAALLLLGVALRRRRQVSAARPAPPPTARHDRQPPRR